ncbi:VOC family protein [Nocardia sp. NPDC051756]|uniref:VOC family protein n=1 Tax=Nocardia sp. NPDC051756 TaxID=3154751 RepID=UPI0034134C21
MTGLDHLVLATPDLPESVATVTRLLGVAPVPGGRHVGRGTRNFLLGLGDGAYLELIGPDDDQPAPAFPRPFGIDGLTESRLLTWAARVNDIGGAVAEARAAGYDPGDASEMSRDTPDGQVLRWRLTLSRDGSHTGVIPFLIDWGATAHPSVSLPQVNLRAFEVTHPNPAAISTQLRALSIDLTVRPGLRPALIATLDGPSGALTLL